MPQKNNAPETLRDFKCGKCENQPYETGEIRTTGGGLSRFFDVQNQKFSHITCENCGFTEFFKRRSGKAGNIMALFLGG